MWYATRYEGFEEPNGTRRSPVKMNFLSGMLSGLLRTGFLLQVIGLTGLFLTYYVFKGDGFFTYDLVFTTEEQRSSVGFRNGLKFFSGVQLVAAVHILLFQAILADDAAWARGYRAGSKLLGNASFFDVVSSTLQFIMYVYMGAHYDQKWWSQYKNGGVEWLVSSLARMIHGFSSVYYAVALFLLETYNDTGTNDWHGVLNCVLFTVSGIAEIVLQIFSNGVVAMVLSWISLVSALVWAMAFEEEVNASAPLLSDPELTNEIESQVEKFARSNSGIPNTVSYPQCATVNKVS